MAPGGFVGLGMLLIKEAPAGWLSADAAIKLCSLIWVRGGDTPEVHADFAEILMGIQEEIRATEDITRKELLLSESVQTNHRRFLELCQQLTGNTSSHATRPKSSLQSELVPQTC